MKHYWRFSITLIVLVLVVSAFGQQSGSSDLKGVDVEMYRWIGVTAKRDPSRLAAEYARRVARIRQSSPGKRYLYETILLGFAADWAVPKEEALDESLKRYASMFASDSSYEARKARLLLQGTGWGTAQSYALAHKLLSERPDDEFVLMAALRPTMAYGRAKQGQGWLLSDTLRLQRAHSEYVFLWYVSGLLHVRDYYAPGSDRRQALREAIKDFQYFVDHTAGNVIFRNYARFQIRQKSNDLLAK